MAQERETLSNTKNWFDGIFVNIHKLCHSVMLTECILWPGHTSGTLVVDSLSLLVKITGAFIWTDWHTERCRKMKDIPNGVSSRTGSILLKYGFDHCWFGYFHRGVFKCITIKYWGLVTTISDNYLLEKIFLQIKSEKCWLHMYSPPLLVCKSAYHQ